VIFGVTLINAIIGFLQESKAESAIAAESVTTEATVIRNGQKVSIPPKNWCQVIWCCWPLGIRCLLIYGWSKSATCKSVSQP